MSAKGAGLSDRPGLRGEDGLRASPCGASGERWRACGGDGCSGWRSITASEAESWGYPFAGRRRVSQPTVADRASLRVVECRLSGRNPHDLGRDVRA